MPDCRFFALFCEAKKSKFSAKKATILQPSAASAQKLSTNFSNMKYFLYARKSTDEDDRQVLSIEAQITELREYAIKENLEVVAEFIESKTAKVPGRPVFNEMISKIEKGSDMGILAWNPDRLARNSIDGGKIIYLIDEFKISALKFPTFWFEPTPQGKFMLNIAFGQSKYYIDNLSENIKRGIRQKLRNGELPGLAPIGYLNELRHHTIVKDPERSQIVARLFEVYSNGDSTLEDLQKLSLSLGLVSRRTDKAISLSRIQGMLKNPFYYGVFKRNGELYQGTHEPIISKSLFDKVQEVLSKKGKPRVVKSSLHFAFSKLFVCGECGRAITAEKKTKLSGLAYTYYRCTKKNVVCSQKYVEEREFVPQVNDLIKSVFLCDKWFELFMKRWEEDYKKLASSSSETKRHLKTVLQDVEERLMRLLDAYLDKTVDNEEYLLAKEKLLNKKIEIKEQLSLADKGGNNWLEPFRQWIISAHQAHGFAVTENLEEKRSFLQKIGSNYKLEGRKVAVELKEGFKILAEKPENSVWSG